METIVYTVIAVTILLGLMCLALLLGTLLGRGRQRRCACAEAKRVARLVEERKKAARAARRYSPEHVDPNSLPIIDPEIVRSK